MTAGSIASSRSPDGARAESGNGVVAARGGPGSRFASSGLPCPGRPSAQTGIALVAVLWLVAALALLAAALAAASRTDLRGAQAVRAAAEAAALGDAAIELAVLQMRGSRNAPTRLASANLELDGHTVAVVVAPVGGFIDLNRAPESLLRDLFQYGAGLDPVRADALAQRVLDWRDPDQNPLPLGAEDDAYAAAGVRHRTRGGAFETTEDLLQVLGVGLDVYDKVTALITPYGFASRVDPLAAGDGVLRVLARGNVAAADRLAGARDAGETILDMSALVPEHVQTIPPGMRFRVEARVGDPDGRVLARVRWIDFGAPGPNGRPWRTLRVEPVRALPAGGNTDGV